MLILLADDDRDDADLFREALEGVEVPTRFVHAEDGSAVFEYLSKSSNELPNLIFLDLNMPMMSGWQCLARLKNDVYFQSIPVIMYSTSSHPRDKEIALELGAIGFVTKPTDFRDLKKILRAVTANVNGDLRGALRTATGF